MAGNIYGYQGVHTPLESVTQGRYTLADYTTMRTELTSRLIALENQGGFIPTNVEITGFLHMLPGGAGLGEIETTSSITGASLYINGEMHGGNVVCDNNLACGGILSGNGSGLTNITGTDSTKLPLAGGTLTGPLISQAITVNAGYTISGNGSGLTNINDITKLPLSGGTLTNSLTITAPGKFIGDGSLLTGVVATDATKLPLAGGTMTGSLTLTAPAKFIGDGSLLTGVVATDATKMPLAGGTFSGTVYFSNPNPAVNYKRNKLWIYDNLVGVTYTPTQTLTSNHDHIRLNYNNACTVDLANLNCDNDAYWQDGMRTITIAKVASVLGGFAVTVNMPTGYLYYDMTSGGTSVTTIGAGVFSVTYQLINFYWGGAGARVDLISKA